MRESRCGGLADLLCVTFSYSILLLINLETFNKLFTTPCHRFLFFTVHHGVCALRSTLVGLLIHFLLRGNNSECYTDFWSSQWKIWREREREQEFEVKIYTPHLNTSLGQKGWYIERGGVNIFILTLFIDIDTSLQERDWKYDILLGNYFLNWFPRTVNVLDNSLILWTLSWY